MSDWQSWDDHKLAEQVLTIEQLVVMRMHIDGLGSKLGARALGITREAYRRRLRRALETMERARQVLT